MSDPDPIKQLQSLVEDRGEVLEKISSIQSALGLIADTAASPPPPPQAVPEIVTENQSVDLTEDRLYKLLLQTLHEMEYQIEERVRPLAQQTIEMEVARLHEQSKHNQISLDECLARIDQCVLSCLERIDEYQSRHSELKRLNDRLARLGAETQPLPEHCAAQNVSEIIYSRLEELRLKGKI